MALQKLVNGRIVDLAAKEEAARAAEEAAEAARRQSEDYQAELDDEWVEGKVNKRRLVALLYDFTQAIPEDRRTPRMNALIGWMENKRALRQQEENR